MYVLPIQIPEMYSYSWAKFYMYVWRHSEILHIDL